MEKEMLTQLKADYAGLLALCKSGQARSTPVPDDKLKKALGPETFCAICASNAPEIDFSLKLFSLQDWFAEHAPPAPAPGDDTADQVYLDACIDSLSAEVARRMESGECDPASIASEAVRDCGTHFSGKLIHSDANGAAMFAPAAASRQPHVSSRSLAARGIRLPLDQSKLDNKGVYQRVVKILNQDAIVEQSKVPPIATKAMEAGAAQAIEQAGKRRTPFVDHRLRQILLPSGEGYLAVSPLAAGGWCALADQAASAVEMAQFLQEQERGQDDKPSPANKQARKRGPKSKDPASDETPPAPKKPRRLFDRLGFPVGGAIVRNTSLHPARAVQNPLYFATPQRMMDQRAAWSFVSVPVRLWITTSEIEQFSKQHAQIQSHDTIGQSSSITAVGVQSSGALAAIVYRLHRTMMDLSALVAEAEYPNGDARVAIDEALLRDKRKEPPTALDLCVVRGSFGAAYRSAMAQAVTDGLARQVVDQKTKAPLLGSVDRERISRAVETLLESA
jgi:hypothetical protein